MESLRTKLNHGGMTEHIHHCNKVKSLKEKICNHKNS